MRQDTPFKIFANCIPVKGATRSVFCDLQRNKVHLIPHALYTIVTEHQGCTIKQIKAAFENKYDEYIDEYFQFLEGEELIFYTEMPQLFPDLDLKWDYPFEISNCILDLDGQSNFDFTSILLGLNQLDCKYLEVRGYTALPMSVYESLLNAAQNTTVTSITLILADNDDCDLEDWENLCDTYSRVCGVTIHGHAEQLSRHSAKFSIPIKTVTRILNDETCCGNIKEHYFTSNTETFAEAQKYNTCLNRKISIDRGGNIKNCPSLPERFGNIHSISLPEATKQPGFKKYWGIGKDQIAVCKDCEFRYVCTDCRAYVEEPGNIYSKPLKCGYDPYTCEWVEWSTHPMKQAAIEHYNLKTLC
ncbi:grasp-with-spasm system SPASM domain peptide maturase [Taibaiella koreensis]|uniref:grasp-with-spasm system SPASM domain peptide maturase n=1 Tax=Taibaiella koreensis TaxID=1268548 RepID=UPI000E59EA0E|nr:grasp-with-spasm system SPASM domain peptide maturase [Taibaiella koreensis]